MSRRNQRGGSSCRHEFYLSQSGALSGKLILSVQSLLLGSFQAKSVIAKRVIFSMARENRDLTPTMELARSLEVGLIALRDRAFREPDI